MALVRCQKASVEIPQTTKNRLVEECFVDMSSFLVLFLKPGF